VRAVIAAADAAGVTAYGSFSTSVETVAIASSRGIRAAEARTSSQLITVSMGPENGTGYAEAAAVDATTIDAAALGREAAETARRRARPAALEPGDYPVVLAEYAVVDILDMLGYLGFSALAVEEGRSFYEPGKRIGSDLVTIRDDARDAAGLPASFDYEGVASEPVTLVDAGRCRDLVWDSADRGAGRAPFHRPRAAGSEPVRPVPAQHAQMAAGATPRAELVRGIERGLSSRGSTTRTRSIRSSPSITGMTRDGTFLVEGGEIVGPVRNLRYTMSYLDALAAVEAVSSERRLLKGFLGGVLVPAVRLGSWRFTGTTGSD
jgi:PmbA protein